MGFGRSVKSPQRLPRILSAKVTGVGAVAVTGTCANNITPTDTGVGDYLLAFEPFQRAPEVVATAVTDNIICKIGTVAVGSVQILTENLSGVATDGDFHVMILGSDAEVI